MGRLESTPALLQLPISRKSLPYSPIALSDTQQGVTTKQPQKANSPENWTQYCWDDLTSCLASLPSGSKYLFQEPFNIPHEEDTKRLSDINKELEDILRQLDTIFQK